MPNRHPHDAAGRLPRGAVPRADVPDDVRDGGAVRVHAQDGVVRAGVRDRVPRLCDADRDGERGLLEGGERGMGLRVTGEERGGR